VHFDNNTAWNDGVVDARLVLAVTVDEKTAEWPLELRDVMVLEEPVHTMAVAAP
jgi:hypothetical protein